MKVSVLEAKNRLSELIRTVQAGGEVVIANRGKPVARLVAEPDASERDALGSSNTILDWLERNPRPPYAGRSAAEIDADILAERQAWD